MSVVSAIIGTAERVPLPDVVIRAAIQRLCSRTATRMSALGAEDEAAFAGRMMLRPIAEDADAGHDDLPAAFYAQVLGPNRNLMIDATGASMSRIPLHAGPAIIFCM